MTSRERIARILKRQPVDRIGVHEHFWGDCQKKWTAEGHLKPDEPLSAHFGLDLDMCWAFNFVADLDYVNETLEETADTITQRDGNGAVFRRHKQHDATPEHIAFAVKERADWERLIRPHIERTDERRINFTAYRDGKQFAANRQSFYVWSGTNVFEIIKDVTGHETMLMAMLDDPDWVRDMANLYADLIVRLWERLFAKEGLPDGIWFYEDMGFKQRPFMAPELYRKIIQPAHARTIGWAHAHGLPVIMHSCGFVEPLLPDMLDAGIDCLQVIEVKAGMDPIRIHQKYGDRLSLMGGMDVRVLYTNDLKKVDAELEAKIPILKQGYGYVLHSDHSIPDTVNYETYRHFVRRGLELGTY